MPFTRTNLFILFARAWALAYISAQTFQALQKTYLVLVTVLKPATMPSSSVLYCLACRSLCGASWFMRKMYQIASYMEKFLQAYVLSTL